MMKTKTLFFLIFLFNSCFVSAEEIWEEIDTSQLIAWDTFDLVPGFDFTGMMVDVLKGKPRKNYEKKEWVSGTVFTPGTTITVHPPGAGSVTIPGGGNTGTIMYRRKRRVNIFPPDLYAKKPNYGLNLGNGIFFNYSGEFFFFIPELRGMNYETGFEILANDEHGQTLTHTWKDNKYSINSSKRMLQRRELLTAKKSTSKDELLIYFSKKLKSIFTFSDKGLEFLIKNRKLKGGVKSESGNEFTLWKKYKDGEIEEEKVEKISSNELLFNGKTKMKIEGKVLKYRNNIRIVKTQKSIFVFRNEDLILEVNIKEKEINIFEGEDLKAFYRRP